jgi:uncharacterized surface protein with fasciclin (FAS1) repeats
MRSSKRSVLLWAAALAISLTATRAATAADIVDTAAKSGQFKTLVAAVKAAGLVGTLKGEGPFTVFAPTDAAFAKLPKGTPASLLKPENKGKLVAILTYHVAPGKLMAADVTGMTSGSKVGTVNGAKVTLTHDRRGVRVNKARVVTADVVADNGVIHVIDAVLLPPAK